MYRPNQRGLSSVARQSFVDGLFRAACQKGAHYFTLKADGPVKYEDIQALARKRGLALSALNGGYVLAKPKPQTEAA
jgi:hypothetical protein